MEDVTPTQDLVLDVLAARERLGEKLWTFGSRHSRAIDGLVEQGLAWKMHGTISGTIRAGLTDRGRSECLSADYTPPNALARDEVVTLPSGTEISVEAAMGDIEKSMELMATDKSNDWSAELADLSHVAELIVLLAGRASDADLLAAVRVLATMTKNAPSYAVTVKPFADAHQEACEVLGRLQSAGVREAN